MREGRTNRAKGCAAGIATVVFGLSFAPAAPADDTRRYDWLIAGEVSGSHVLVVREDNTRISDFEFNDRGRGPKIHEELKTGEKGSLVSLRIAGHSYMGAPADESFRLEDGVARWKSTLEQGEAETDGYYAANDGTPEQLAHMARALLASESGQLELFPAGRASIRKVLGQVVPFQGETFAVTLYSISGLGLTPQYLWLDERRELFALAGGWIAENPFSISPRRHTFLIWNSK